MICRPPSVCNMPQAENHPINWAEGRALHAAEPTVIVSGKKAVAAMTCPGAVPLKTARMSTGVTIKQDSANMPSAVAEAPAAARYVADVWRLNAASRLQNADGKQKRHCAIKLNANGRLDNLLSAICRSSPHEAGGGTNERKRMAGYSPAASPIKSKGDLSHERNEAL